MKKSKRKSGLNRELITAGIVACLAADLALAEPSGPAVVNGTVSFQQTGNLLQITNSPNAIINWQSFSIGASEITRFLQQSPSSAVLNRVVSQNPSSILGALQSNGRVFLINPNGIAFGAGARIDVSGLVASTLNLSNQDFIAGRLNFVSDPAKAAAVVNQGRVTAGEGGRVYLVGSAVDNQGVITAPNGEIVLAAGNSVRVTESAGSRLRVEITAPADKAVNLSEAVYGSRGIYGGLVRNSGVISANSAIRGADGRIILKASTDATLEGTSRITANGAQGGSVTAQAEKGTLLVGGTFEATGSEAKGGTVQLLGEQVGLVNGAAVDASGKTGGGTVLIGGDYQGKTPEIQNALRTYIGPDAIVRADATESGDGGKVIVWADDTTRYFGTISAKGGALSGDGGFVEVSGKEYLTFKGKVDTRAPQGRAGTLLLDPANIVISDGSGDSANDADALTTSFAGSGSGTGVVVSGDDPVGGTLTLFQTELEGIASTTNIALQATSAITINDLTNNNLNLAQAGGNSVSFNSAVFHMDASDTITTAGGALNITATGAATVGGLSTAGGAIALNLGGASTVSGVIAGTGTTLTKNGAGTLTLSGTNTYTGSTTINAGSLNIQNSAALGTAAAGTTVVAGAALELQGGITVGAEALSITGTGVGANGALRNISGANTWGGTLTLTGASEIQSDAGTLTLNAANSVTGAFALTVDGAAITAINGSITTGANTLTKNGTGTLTLSGTNTYTGATAVNAGVLNIQNAQGTGTAAGGVTVASGAVLELQGGIAVGAEALSIAGTGAGGNGALRNIGGANTWGGTVTQTAASEIQSDAGTLTLSNTVGGAFALTVDGAAATTMSGVVGAGALSLIKNGTGTLTLSGAGANTYTGATTVNAGVLNLQKATATGTVAGGVTVADGAALELQGTFAMGAEALNLSGTGISGGGALRSISGTNSWAGAITLANAARINSDTGAALTLSGGVANGANSLTVGGAGTTAFTTAAIAGARQLIKDGSGTVSLGFANTYTGATTISAGTLTLGVANAIATSPGVANGGDLTLGASNIIDSMTGAGTTTLGANSLTIGDASNTSSAYSGVISGAGGIIKAGTGALTLSGASNYTGATAINAGVLNIQSATATGTAAGGVTVANNAALELQGGITVGAEALSIAGTGVGANGALRNISGANTWGGTVTQTAASRIQTDAGSLTLSGAVSGAFALTKTGAGTLTLAAANTYTGTTTVSGGALTLSGIGTAVGSPGFTVNQGGTLTLDNSGTNNNNRIAGTLAMNGGEFVVLGNAGAQTTEAIGALTLSSGHSTITLTPDAAQNTQVTFASLARTAGATGLFRGTNLGANTVASNTAGASNIVFTAAPALTGGGGNSGTTTVSIVAGAIGAGGAAGATSLGTDFITYNPPMGAVNGLRPLLAGEYAAVPAANVNLRLVANRTADDTFSINSLLLSGGITYNYDSLAGANTLTLGGAALSGNVLSIGGANTIQTTTNPAGGLAFGTAGAKIFALTDLTLGANSPVTGTGGFAKSGAGVLLENRATTFTGGLFVNQGTLRNGINAAFATQALNVRAAGTRDLNGFNNTNTVLNLQSGSTFGANVTTGAGTLTLTTTGAATLVHSLNGDGAAGANISGNLVLPATPRITAANGAAVDDLTISAVVSGAATTLTKAGVGTLVFSNANIYTGATAVNAGVLNIRNANGTGTTAGGVTVANNAALQLQGGITVGAEALSITGNGVGGTGALRNIGGNNTWGGTVTLAGASEIQSDAGTLTLNAANAVTSGAAQTLAFDGAGNTTVSGTIVTPVSTLTKNGTGTLTLSGANTYTGATAVNAGVLNIQNATALGATAAGTTVAAGAALELQGGIAVGAETLNLNGTGISGGGALRNVSGTNSWAGAITLANAARINSDTVGNTLTMSGGVTNAGFLLTVGGAGNTAFTTAAITGAGGLTKDGAGTLSLGFANTYTGATNVNAGTLAVTANNALGTNVAGTTVTSGATLDLQNVIYATTEAITLNGGTLATSTGTSTLAGTVALGTGGGTLNVAGTQFTLSGVVSGANALTKTGAGIAVLSGANTYTGATTVSGGTLRAGVASVANVSGAFGNNSAVTLGNTAGVTLDTTGFATQIGSLTGGGSTGGNVTLGAATLLVGGDNTSPADYAGVISGTGAITKIGTGTLTLSGDNSYSGLTTISAGTLKLGANGGATNTPLGTVAAGTIVSAGATLDLNGFTLGTAEALTLNGMGISNGGALTNSAAGAATYSGLITLGSDSSIVAGNGNIVISNTGTITGAGFGLTLGGTSAASSIASIIGTTTGTVTKTGSGTWTLSGANTYTGVTAVDAGTLELSGGAAIADAGVIRMASGTTLDLTGSSEVMGLLSNNTAGGTVTSSAGGAVTVTTGVEANSTFAGVIQDGSGTVALTKQGSGVFTLSGANTYGGDTTITAGTLKLGAANVIPDGAGTGNVSVAGRLDLNTFSETINGLSGAGTVDTVAGGTPTLTAGNNNATSTFSGIIQNTAGTLELTKIGAGVLTLSGANTYDGATQVAAGTLIASNALALGSTVGGTSVTAGATLNVNSVAIGTEAVTLNGTGVGGNGALTATGSASLAGVVTLSTDSTIGVAAGGDALTLSGAIEGTGALDLTGAGSVTFGGTVGATTALASLTQGASTTLNINGGLVRTSGNQTYAGSVTTSGATTLRTTAGGAISATGAVTATAGTLTLDTGAGDATFNNASNNFGTVAVTSGNDVSVTDANALVLGASTVSGTLGVTTSGAITQSGIVSVTGTTTLAAGAANNITLANGSNNFSTVAITSGNNVSIADTNALDLGTSAVNGTLLATAGGDLSLAGNLSAAAAGDALTLVAGAGANFLNPGSATLSTPSGRWLVYSTNPASDTRGGLVYNFKHYGLTYTGPYGGPGTGNGFIYGVAPTITPSLVSPPTPSKVYDGTTTATLVASNYASSGAIDGDTVTLDNPVAGTYDNRNVGAGKNVSTTVAIASANNGAASVYGYTLSSTTASGNIGTITARPITVTAATDSKTYDGTTSSAGAPTHAALQSGDTTTTFAQSFDNRNAGAGKTLTATGVVNDGNGGANYSYTFVTDTTGLISQRGLAVTAATDSKTYDGTTSSAGAPTHAALQSGDTTTTFAQSFDNRNAGAGKTLTATGVVNDGNGGANYSYTFVTDTTGLISQRGLAVTAATDSKTYDGTTSSAGAPTHAALQSGDTTTTFAQSFDNRNAGAGKTLTATGVVNDGNGGANYSYTFVTDTTGLISQRGLAVTAATDSKTYDGTTSSAGAPVVTGTLYDAVGTAATQTYDTQNVGITKTLTASGLVMADGNGGNNYAINYVADATGVITAAALSVTADDKSRPQGTSNPPFTATYGGFQAGETPAVLTGTLSFSTPATIGSPVGSYSITPFGQSSTNYAITYFDGTLVVSSGIAVAPQVPASLLDQLTNPLIASFQQLGVGDHFAQTTDCMDQALFHAGVEVRRLTIKAPWACRANDVVTVANSPRP